MHRAFGVLVAGLSISGLGCPGVQQACTEIGCYDFFEIELAGPDGSAVGDFAVTADYGGGRYEETCLADHLVTHGGFDCGEGRIVFPYAGEGPIDLAVETLDGTAGWAGTVETWFDDVVPNGEGCPPICQQGSSIVELDDLEEEQQGPQGIEVDVVGDEEVCGDFPGARPSVALDSMGQPHVLTDTGDPGLGAELRIYHRLGGDWQEEVLATASDPPVESAPASIAEPRLEIDPLDRAWASAHYFRSNVYEACGIGVFVIDDVATQPTLSAFDKLNIGSVGWSNGNLSLDPARPDEGVVMTYDGEWARVDPSAAVFEQGQMYIGNSGEKLRFRIAANDGAPGVWHGVTSGWGPSPSGYQNSVRDDAGLGHLVWADYDTYPIQGEDTRHMALGLDRADPEVAYISVIYEPGLVINVFDGEALAWPSNDLPVIDAEADYVHRFGPQWAPALEGGAFLCWSRSGRIKLRYVGPDGALGEEVDVSDGSHPALATDDEGHLHLAYRNGGMRYRKIWTR